MRGMGGLIGLAAALLALALALDLLWYKPQRENVDRLMAERSRVQKRIQDAEHSGSETEDVTAYFQDREEPDADWHESYASQEALDVLERVRGMSGVSRRALSLENKETGGGLAHTTYYMSVNGTYTQALKFIRSLEEALPLVKIDSFIIENPPGTGSRVTLSLNATVITLGGSS